MDKQMIDMEAIAQSSCCLIFCVSWSKGLFTGSIMSDTIKESVNRFMDKIRKEHYESKCYRIPKAIVLGNEVIFNAEHSERNIRTERKS